MMPQVQTATANDLADVAVEELRKMAIEILSQLSAEGRAEIISEVLKM